MDRTLRKVAKLIDFVQQAAKQESLRATTGGDSANLSKRECAELRVSEEASETKTADYPSRKTWVN